MPVILRSKKGRSVKRHKKISSSSLHGHAIAVSVDERLEELVRRFPAMRSSVGSLLLDGKKRIRDFPAPEQERILRLVFALKKASGG